MYQEQPTRKPITITTLAKMKRDREKFAVLTAYDASFAALLEAAGVEVILVGDSLGMVVQGQRTTVPVTMEDMIYHTRLVARGCQTALLMADMPFASYATVEQGVRNAARLMGEGGAHMVKLEGGGWLAETVRQTEPQRHSGLRPSGPAAAVGAQAGRLQGAGPRGSRRPPDHRRGAGLAGGRRGRGAGGMHPGRTGGAADRGAGDPADRHRRRVRTATPRCWSATTCWASPPAAGRSSPKIS